MGSVRTQQGAHFFVRPTMSPRERESHGVLRMKVSDAQSVGVTKSGKARNCRSPRTDALNLLELACGIRWRFTNEST